MGLFFGLMKFLFNGLVTILVFLALASLIYFGYQEYQVIKQTKADTYANNGTCEFDFPWVRCSYTTTNQTCFRNGEVIDCVDMD